MCSGDFGEVGMQNLEARLGQAEGRMVWMWCRGTNVLVLVAGEPRMLCSSNQAVKRHARNSTTEVGWLRGDNIEQ
jgi:hypothetical protein